MQGVEGIVVDPDSNRRTQLKQACFGVPKLRRIDSSHSLDEALRKLSVKGDYDYTAIFISKRFKKDEITNFIRSAKKTPRGQDSAYVLVLLPNEQESQVMSEGLLGGADSFLLEPFSVDSLNQTADLAVEIKKQRQDIREQAIASLLIKDILKHIDLVAERLVRKQEGGAEYKYLKDLKAKVSELNERMLGYFKEYLPRLLKEQPAPTLTLQQEASVSKSSKHRIHLKAIERLKARGIDTSSLEENEGKKDYGSLWQVTDKEGGVRVLTFLHEPYDKPTADSLLEYINSISDTSIKIYELDFSKVKFISAYALNKIFECSQTVVSRKAKLRMRDFQSFNLEVATLLKLTEIFP